MRLTVEKARKIVWGQSEDWRKVECNLVDNDIDIWHIHHEGIFKHISTEKYYKFKWTTGETDHEYELPFYFYKYVEPVEVHKVEKVVQVWEPINA